MLSKVTAVRFDRPMSAGKTKPCLMGCRLEDGSETDLVVKFAARCEMKYRSLTTEAVAALLAADLGLPVPEPFLVQVEAELADTIPDSAHRALVQTGLGWNFGSRLVSGGFRLYASGSPIPDESLTVAGEIMAFDHFVANPDRSVRNPNLLFNGREFAMYDHELAFFGEATIGWRPPWDPAGAPSWRLQGPQMRHVLWAKMQGEAPALSRLESAFDSITPQRLNEYRAALPWVWIGDGVALEGMLDYIVKLKENVSVAINQASRALL